MISVFGIIAIVIACLVFFIYRASNKEDERDIGFLEYSFSQVGTLLKNIDDAKIANFEHKETGYGEHILMDVNFKNSGALKAFVKNLKDEDFSGSTTSKNELSLFMNYVNKETSDSDGTAAHTESKFQGAFDSQVEYKYEKTDIMPRKDNGMNKYHCKAYIAKDNHAYLLLY